MLGRGGKVTTLMGKFAARVPMDLLNAVLEIIATDARGDDGASSLDCVRRRVEQMGQDSRDPRAPVREVLARIGDKWSPLLLIALEFGEFRFTTLQRLVGRLSYEGRISRRMLTFRLRSLESDGLVERRVTTARSPKVTYALTELGHGLLGHIDSVIWWVRTHHEQILQARERFVSGCGTASGRPASGVPGKSPS